jgi:uncharacterized protein YceH (UPF0502 family)
MLMDAAAPSTPSESRSHPLSEPLSALEARVLGCLIEKELSTPEYYPLSLNALVNACNQKNNRDPVMLLSAREVEVTLDGMRSRRLAGLFAGADARVPKFKHTLDLVAPIEVPDRAVLAELLLRGPQTGGELRSRCERMFVFGGLDQVEEVLARLAARPAGAIVRHLARQPGQKEARWAQLLTGEPNASTENASSRDSGAAGGDVVAPLPLTARITLPPEAEVRFAALEAEVARLGAELEKLRQSLGG